MPQATVTGDGYRVTRARLTTCREYTDIGRSASTEDGVDLALAVEGWQKPIHLGLHWNGYTGEIRPSHFVGAVWLRLPERVPLIVGPKIGDVDAVRMFTEIGRYHELLSDMPTLFCVWPEQPPIPAPDVVKDLSLLQVAVYLRELAAFCQRDLRQEMVVVQENLMGRVKGRVLVTQDVRLNGARGRADRVVCRYGIVSHDNLPNQILKAALAICTAYLGQVRTDGWILWQWARASEGALSGVSVRRIAATDFLGLRYGGFLRRYRAIHRLARMIIVRLRVEAGGRVVEADESKTVPFALNMNRLFEAYVGVKLRQAGVQMRFQQARRLGDGHDLELTIRPDYVSPDGRRVVDAKYKAIANPGREGADLEPGDGLQLGMATTGLSNSDAYQVIAYSLIEGGGSIGERRAFLAVPSHDRELSSAWRPALLEDVPSDIPHLGIPIPGGGILTVGVLPCRLPLLEERRARR